MASTTFRRGSTHTNLVPQKWSSKDYKWMFEANPLKPFMGVGDNNIIEVNKDFLKSQGDYITFALRALLAGDGQGDDGTYEGNEEAMIFYDFPVQIHERGHSTQLSGNMTEQAAYAKLRPRGRRAIREWAGRIKARDIIDALSGLPSKKFAGVVSGANAVDASSVQIATVNQQAITKSATATRWFGGGQNSTGTIERVASDSAIDSTSTNLFGTQVIDYLKRMATRETDSLGNPITPIRPVMVNGKPTWVLFVDQLCVKQLRQETAWKAAQQEANKRGHDNPIFSGAEGIWGGVVIKETELLHRRLGAGGVTATEFFDTSSDACANEITVVRSLFCGAQAAAVAYGKMPVWKDGYVDWQRTKWGTHTDMIYGVSKTVFNSVDFGCIVCDCAVITD